MLPFSIHLFYSCSIHHPKVLFLKLQIALNLLWLVQLLMRKISETPTELRMNSCSHENMRLFPFVLYFSHTSLHYGTTLNELAKSGCLLFSSTLRHFDKTHGVVYANDLFVCPWSLVFVCYLKYDPAIFQLRSQRTCARPSQAGPLCQFYDGNEISFERIELKLSMRDRITLLMTRFTANRHLIRADRSLRVIDRQRRNLPICSGDETNDSSVAQLSPLL